MLNPQYKPVLSQTAGNWVTGSNPLRSRGHITFLSCPPTSPSPPLFIHRFSPVSCHHVHLSSFVFVLSCCLPSLLDSWQPAVNSRPTLLTTERTWQQHWWDHSLNVSPRAPLGQSYFRWQLFCFIYSLAPVFLFFIVCVWLSGVVFTCVYSYVRVPDSLDDLYIFYFYFLMISIQKEKKKLTIFLHVASSWVPWGKSSFKH